MVKSRQHREQDDDALDLVFRALADRSRRGMLARLSRGTATVSELAAPLAMSLPAVSKHLGVLEDAGLVTRERSGRVRVCTIDPASLEPADAWIRDRLQFWNDSLDAFAALAEQQATDPQEEPE